MTERFRTNEDGTVTMSREDANALVSAARQGKPPPVEIPSQGALLRMTDVERCALIAKLSEAENG